MLNLAKGENIFFFPEMHNIRSINIQHWLAMFSSKGGEYVTYFQLINFLKTERDKQKIIKLNDNELKNIVFLLKLIQNFLLYSEKNISGFVTQLSVTPTLTVTTLEAKKRFTSDKRACYFDDELQFKYLPSSLYRQGIF